MKKHLLLAAVASLAFAPAAWAQTSPAPTQKSTQPGAAQGQGQLKAAQGQLKQADSRFVENAAIGGMFEVQSSELAMNKAESAEVKDFARQMIRDHGKANRELGELAPKVGAQLPKQLDSKHSQVLQKLGAQSGPAFDRMYIQAQLDAHNEAVPLFRNYTAANTSNPELKQFAEQTLPVLQQHRQHIQGMSGVAQGEGKSSTGRSSAEPMPKPLKQAPQ